MLEVIVVLVVFGVVALLLGMSRWLAHRPWASAGNLSIALVLFFMAHHFWSAAIDLQTYEPLPAKAMIAQVYCERTGSSAYRVTLTRLPGGRMQVFEMSGDEWRVDARILVWKGRAAQFGLSPDYRLERLTARYQYVAEDEGNGTSTASRAPPSGYALNDVDAPGEDFWAQARTGTQWDSQVDASHAYGPWRRMADGARYDVWMTRGPHDREARIDAQPGNEAAAKAMLYTRTNNNVRTQG